MPVPKEVKMAFRKWSWICVVVGIFGMNVFTRYSFAEEKYAEKNRVPAISNEYQGITPEFSAWLQKF